MVPVPDRDPIRIEQKGPILISDRGASFVGAKRTIEQGSWGSSIEVKARKIPEIPDVALCLAPREGEGSEGQTKQTVAKKHAVKIICEGQLIRAASRRGRKPFGC